MMEDAFQRRKVLIYCSTKFIDEFMFGVRQLVEVVMDQKHNENVVVVFQGGKQMNLFNEIDERIFQCDGTENRITQEDC